MGIITAKKTKVTKSGGTMAVLTVEDALSEIEVIAFPKQYAKFGDKLYQDSAVMITGNISAEDDEAPRIFLSDVLILSQNGEFSAKSEYSPRATVNPTRLFIKLPTINDSRMNIIYRVAQFNRGDTPVVVYDESTRRYSQLKGVSVDASEKTLAKLRGTFGDVNVVLK